MVWKRGSPMDIPSLVPVSSKLELAENESQKMQWLDWAEQPGDGTPKAEGQIGSTYYITAMDGPTMTLASLVHTGTYDFQLIFSWKKFLGSAKTLCLLPFASICWFHG